MCPLSRVCGNFLPAKYMDRFSKKGGGARDEMTDREIVKISDTKSVTWMTGIVVCFSGTEQQTTRTGWNYLLCYSKWNLSWIVSEVAQASLGSFLWLNIVKIFLYKSCEHAAIWWTCEQKHASPRTLIFFITASKKVPVWDQESC